MSGVRVWLARASLTTLGLYKQVRVSVAKLYKLVYVSVAKSDLLELR